MCKSKVVPYSRLIFARALPISASYLERPLCRRGKGLPGERLFAIYAPAAL